MGVADDVDDVLHGARVGEGGGGRLHDVGLFAAHGPLAQTRAVVEFVGGVADDAEDPAGAAVGVTGDVSLGTDPGQGAVTAAYAQVGAVVLAGALHGLGDQGVQAGALAAGDAGGQALGAAVVLLRGEVEDPVGLGVHGEQTGVQVPVEAAHAVEREDRIGVGGPALRECPSACRPLFGHGATLPGFARFFEWTAG
ncbi:hypothetical protein GCM10010512_04120 [Streptomyces thermoviolaceus subsp. thermoviolaceus]|nr:hypothetical protein GCM10010512_04120 [Streptomyces thermoviolaceus subsp. thermoviolaceus]